ncbi:dioxygenase family protein [Alicyclobacillus macrosporangiidus]|uniref:4,5-DOPA dioxygenase extradiol n=1 Tax=Alicyclobacillus macrosporangiidus TaxID=392015 RepID=A0A1I7F2I4_9BACL|nr:class III extradiol ring-cleavage dioxygenase [Alicyclobacillus macrosporangiidus]SFU30408.1 4,5-DOPA dioxygenase extradiol [Alicyclobacillus macrosporangiidus]
MSLLPSLFIAHGSPMVAVEDSVYGRFLDTLGSRLRRPRAVVVFTAHWLSGAQAVSASPNYETIHDFGGFPDELYQIQYPAPGEPALAGTIRSRLAEAGVPCHLDARRGLDHGVWTILRRLYPDASIPVVAMSVNPRLTPAGQFAIGQALAPLRADDVLIIGSGATVHNLAALDWARQDGVPDEWALAFETWLESRLVAWDLEALFDYRRLAPGAHQAVPAWGTEHFAPLLYAMGAAADTPSAALWHRDFQFGNLCNSVYAFGVEA